MKFDDLFFFEVDDNITVIIENHLLYVSVKVKDKTKPLFMRKKTIYQGNKDDDYHRGFFHALDLLIDDFSDEEYYRYNLLNNYSPFKLFISTIKYDPYGFIETISNMKTPEPGDTGKINDNANGSGDGSVSEQKPNKQDGMNNTNNSTLPAGSGNVNSSPGIISGGENSLHIMIE